MTRRSRCWLTIYAVAGMIAGPAVAIPTTILVAKAQASITTECNGAEIGSRCLGSSQTRRDCQRYTDQECFNCDGGFEAVVACARNSEEFCNQLPEEPPQ